MRPKKVESERLIQGLYSVLRMKGYDGASLSELADACGLQKASLYHRYPGGKKQIVSEVLIFIREYIEEEIYGILSDNSIAPDIRLKRVLKTLDKLYNGGDSSCLWRSLSMDTGMDFFGEQIKEGMERWISGFRKLGVSMGLTKEEAADKAMQTLILIQGSLVVSKGTSSKKPFQKSLRLVERLYLTGQKMI